MSTTIAKHEITRVRHEAPRRTLEVRRVERPSPLVRRVVLGGAELDGFASPAPDDHIKLFVDAGDGTTAGRHYTPRRYDPATNELSIDFVLHGEGHAEGPVTRWALAAEPGATLTLGGPRGSALVPADFDWWLLLGDETALPAIARRVEELPPGAPVTTVVAVAGPAEEQAIDAAAQHRAVWVHRPAAGAADPAPMLEALRRFQPPPGDGFVFIAGEAGVVRALRTHVLEVMRHQPRWVKASGYWKRGEADVHETMG